VTELDLANEELKDLGYLPTLPALEVLSLANNPIEDLKPLTHLKKLKYLDLSETNPKDLAPLQEIESLQLLRLNRSESQLIQLEQLKKTRPDLQITLTGKDP
jgi:Leucine-rich repeat (LRR) protein